MWRKLPDANIKLDTGKATQSFYDQTATHSSRGEKSFGLNTQAGLHSKYHRNTIPNRRDIIQNLHVGKLPAAILSVHYVTKNFPRLILNVTPERTPNLFMIEWELIHHVAKNFGKSSSLNTSAEQHSESSEQHSKSPFGGTFWTQYKEWRQKETILNVTPGGRPSPPSIWTLWSKWQFIHHVTKSRNRNTVSKLKSDHRAKKHLRRNINRDTWKKQY